MALSTEADITLTYEPDPPPRPTPMASIGESTTGYGAANATDGGIKCPDEATPCPTLADPEMMKNCNDGICCEHINGQQLCSCFPGYDGLDCDEHELILASTIQDSSNSMVILGVVLVLLFISLSIIAFFVYRWRKRRLQQRSQQSQHEREPLKIITSSDVTVVPNSTSIRQHEDTNGNDKDVRT